MATYEYQSPEGFIPPIDYIGVKDEQGNMKSEFTFMPEYAKPQYLDAQSVNEQVDNTIRDSFGRQGIQQSMTEQGLQATSGMSAVDRLEASRGGVKQRAKLASQAGMWGDVMRDRNQTAADNANIDIANEADMFNTGLVNQANTKNIQTLLDDGMSWEEIQRYLRLTQQKIATGEDVAGVVG
jgi:hypothetical protein